MFIFIVGYLILLILLQVFAKKLLAKNIRIFTVIPIVVIFGIGAYYSYLQYNLWNSLPETQGLLPPVTPIAYYLRYILYRFFITHIISLVFATVFYFLAKFINRRKDERFFEKEELNLAFVSLFLSGFPGVFFVFTFIILAYLCVHIINLFVKKKIEVVPLYHLWLPASLLAIILISIWFNKFEVFQLLRII